MWGLSKINKNRLTTLGNTITLSAGLFNYSFRSTAPIKKVDSLNRDAPWTRKAILETRTNKCRFIIHNVFHGTFVLWHSVSG